MRYLLLFFLALAMGGAQQDDPETIHYSIKLMHAGNGAPLPGLRVRLDDRTAWSDTTGTARFEYLTAPGKRIVVDSPDYARVEREAGPAGELEIALEPLVRSAVTFKCVLADSGEAVPGTHIRLARKDRLFPVRPLDGWADFAGSLPFREVPPGPYIVEADAPGCLPWKGEVLVNEGQTDKELNLPPAVKPVRLKGRARPGAIIRALRASGDEGAAPTATCDAGGNFLLEIPGRSRGPGAMPSRTVLHAQAAGFLDGFVPVDFSDASGAITIPMVPEHPLSTEVQPNDSPRVAAPAPWQTTFRTRVEQAGDKDYFAVDFLFDGLITLRHEPLPCSTSIRLIDPRGKERGIDLYSKHTGKTDFDIKAGRHLIVFHGWGSRVQSAEFATVHLGFTPAVDPNEWNDEAALATPVTLGTDIRGAVFPKGDRDYFRLRVNHAGILQTSMKPYPISMSLRVHDTRGREIARQDVYPKQPASFLARLPGPGYYLVSLEHWGNTQYSTAPYSMRLDFAPADVQDRTLPLDGFVSGSINPIGDRDAWRLKITSSGTLRVRLSLLPIGTTVRVLAPDGSQVSRRDAHDRQSNEHFVSLQASGTYTVEVSNWGGSRDSPLPYVLSTAFFPNDFWDMRHNETRAASSRVTLSRTITGSIATKGDRDFYRFQIPRRGLITAEIPVFTLPTRLSLFGQGPKPLLQKDAYARQANALAFHVKEPGTHWLSIEHWGNTLWSADRYRMTVRIDREDVFEPNDDFAHAVRLPVSTALPGTILPVDEKDCYRIVIPRAGRYRLSVGKAPYSRSVFLFDPQGKQLWRRDIYSAQKLDHVWEHPVQGPAYLRIQGWGSWQASPDRYAVWVTPEDADPPPLAILQAVRGEKPRTVRLTLDVEGAAGTARIDTNGDGRFDLDMAAGESMDVEYARGGVYPVLARVDGATGTGWDFVWADARDPAREAEVMVEFLHPPPDSVLDADTVVELDAWARDGSAVDGAEIFLDDRSLGRFGRPPYSVELEAGSFAGRECRLKAIVWSASGKRAQAELPLRVAPLVNLRPDRSERITSGEALIEWDTAEPGSSEVTVSALGIDPMVFKGVAGKKHAVKVSGLEPGFDYTWQARTGELASEPRRLSVIRGIEFVHRTYTTEIARDYDQKGVVRVVNHGDAPASLELHVESKQGDLLVGFVGEGSPDKKVSLEPGEYRDVLLGIAAQDAMQEDYRFHVSLEGSFGVERHSDVVPFDVTVRMPNIDFDVIVSDPEEGTLARIVEIINKGETITDLNAFLEDEGMAAYVTPDIEHVRLEQGRRMSFRVEPVLTPEFEGLAGPLMIKGIHVEKKVPLTFDLPAGKRVFLATVGCGQHNRAAAWFCTNRPSVTTPVTVATGPQIGQVVSVPPSPLPTSIPRDKQTWRDRIDDENFFLEDVIAELKKVKHSDPCMEARMRADLANEMINARVTTFNSAWGTTRQTFNFWDWGDLTFRAEQVRNPHASQVGSDIARRAWAYQTGACAEHAEMMEYVLKGSGVPKDKVRNLQSSFGEAGGHVYVGVCLQKGADPDRPWTWGDKAFVADSWMGRNFTPQEAWHEGWIFNDGDSDANPGAGYGARYWYRLYQERGPEFIASRLEHFRQKIPADMRDGDKLIPGADQPPSGWLEGGAR